MCRWRPTSLPKPICSFSSIQPGFVRVLMYKMTYYTQIHKTFLQFKGIYQLIWLPVSPNVPTAIYCR